MRGMLADAAVLSAIESAAKGKRNKPTIARRLSRLEDTASQIKSLVSSGSFSPSPMQTMRIVECGKERIISKPPFFPDQIIHWLVVDQLKPLLMRGMEKGVCGSVPGRGAEEAKRLVRGWIVHDRKGTKWCLKIDIHHYYQSIDRSVLFGKVGRLVKDPWMLSLVGKLIGGPGIGIPIGTYWSQWMANLYLQSFDHFVHEGLKIAHEVRYVDDVVVFSPNRRQLMKAQKEMAAFLAKEGLEMKPSWSAFRTSERDVDFVGIRFHGNGKTSIRKRIWREARRTVLRIGHHGLGASRARRLMSYNGWFQGTNNFVIKTKYLAKIDMRAARRKIAEAPARKQMPSERRAKACRN